MSDSYQGYILEQIPFYLHPHSLHGSSTFRPLQGELHQLFRGVLPTAMKCITSTFCYRRDLLQR